MIPFLITILRINVNQAYKSVIWRKGLTRYFLLNPFFYSTFISRTVVMLISPNGFIGGTIYARKLSASHTKLIDEQVASN